MIERKLFEVIKPSFEVKPVLVAKLPNVILVQAEEPEPEKPKEEIKIPEIEEPKETELQIKAFNFRVEDKGHIYIEDIEDKMPYFLTKEYVEKNLERLAR